MKDAKFIRGAELLKAQLQKHIKHVFVSALRCVEIKFGKDFEGYEAMRGEILRVGNDAIRNLHTMIDGKFNVEGIQDIFTIKFTNKDRNGPVGG